MSVRWWLVFGALVVLTGFLGVVVLEYFLADAVGDIWRLYGDLAFVDAKKLLFVTRPKYSTGSQPIHCGREMFACLEGGLLGAAHGGLFIVHRACGKNLPQTTSCDAAVQQLGMFLGLRHLKSTYIRDVVFDQEVEVVSFSGKTAADKTVFGEAACLGQAWQSRGNASTWVLWSVSSQKNQGLLRRATRPSLWDLVKRPWRQPIPIVF